MQQELSHLLIEKFKYRNLITIDDLYTISHKEHVNIISLYRTVVDMIHNKLIEKVFINNESNNATIVDYKSYDTEFAIVKKRNMNHSTLLSQKKIDSILNSLD